MTKVLHVLGSLNQGGLENLIMNLLRNIDRERILFDFMVNDLNEAFYDQEVLSSGSNIYRIGQRKEGLFKYKKSIKNILIENRYDIVHVHTSSLSGIDAAIIAKKHSKSVVIIHSHNTVGPRGIHHKIMATLNQMRVYKICDYMFACGKEAGIACFSPKHENDIIIFNNAIDAEKFDYNLDVRKKYRSDLGLEHKIVLGNIGRFMEQKNHKFLIEIFNSIKEIKDYHLILVGTGVLEKAIREQIEKYGLHESVTILENRRDVNSIMQAIDVVVMPSLFEGLPLVLVEAQAASLAIVASDTITREVDITNTIKYLPLETDMNIWVKTINNAFKDNCRTTKLDLIREKRYDIKYNVSWITNYYESITKKGRENETF